LDQTRLDAQLGRLGGTGWRLERVTVDLDPGLFLPLAALNRLRRSLLQRMAEAGVVPHPLIQASSPLPELSADKRDAVLASCMPGVPDAEPQETSDLVVLVRSLEQLEALQTLDESVPLRAVVADLEQPRELREAVAIGRGCWPDGLWLTGPKMVRPDERWTLEPLLRASPDGFLVRNADQLELLKGVAPCRGDFSLNVANPLALRWFLEHWGLERVTVSCDLNLQQLLDLSDASPCDRLEVVLHQHMPLFHMEHCLFCSLLSDGHDHTDCGRPCEQHTVHLRDRSGVDHALKADLGCRNTLFNGTAQTGVEALPVMQGAGLRHFRLDLLDEDADATLRRVRLYGEALQGRIPSDAVWRQEQIEHRLGVTRGSLQIDRPRSTGSISR